MSFEEYFPVYDKLTPEEQKQLTAVTMERTVPKGTLLHAGGNDCMGLLVIKSGQLRAFSSSEEGREVTLYRLFERDVCLMSASCMMRSLQFDIMISAEKETVMWVIPPDHYKMLMDRHASVANYTNEVMSSRFTEVMWLMEQVMWKSFDRRLADFLMEESTLEGTDTLKITHESIAAHLGTAREVVTRMLKYFQNEGIVRLSRGTVEILDHGKLSRTADN